MRLNKSAFALILTLALALLPALMRHQHLIVANAAHGIMGYPELTPAMLTFLRGQRVAELRVSFPKWELKHPGDR